MPEAWGTPAKNWLKQRAGLLLNDSALQWVWAEAVRQKGEPKPRRSPQQKNSYAVGHRATVQFGFSVQALRLANTPLDPYDPRNVANNKTIGNSFRDGRRTLFILLTHEAQHVWQTLAFEYLHWLRLSFLLDMTPDKQRGILREEWIPSWPEPIRSEILTEYTRLERLLGRYDAQGEETRAWKQRENGVFRSLWNHSNRSLWNAKTLTATLVLMGLRKQGHLRFWNPWEFAGVLQRQEARALSPREEEQLDAWMIGCAAGQFDPNDSTARIRFLSIHH